jgi:hypothetical protein
MLTNLPTMDEVCIVVFSKNKDVGPDPNGFRAFFFYTYRDIVEKEVFNIVQECFISLV